MVLLALHDHFHSAIASVLDPATQTQLFGFALGGGAKEDALNTPPHDEMDALLSHVAHLQLADSSRQRKILVTCRSASDPLHNSALLFPEGTEET